MKKSIFILGSTGVGKSNLALKIGQKLIKEHSSTAIVNADSLQFYKGLDIGTAKPSKADMLLVPHLLFDCLDYPQEATVAWYHSQFFSTLGKEDYVNFLVVGGSGFYIRALESGLYPHYELSPEIKNKYEAICKKKGSEALYKILVKKDPKSAERIHLKDSYRVVRALSIMEASGKSLSEIKEEFSSKKQAYPYLLKKVALFLERDELRKVILTRVESMFNSGFIEEVELLVSLNKGWKPLSSIGYKEVQMHLKGELNKQELEDLIVQSTMALAKRQKTWFKKDQSIEWFHAVNQLQEAEKSICNFVQKS